MFSAATASWRASKSSIRHDSQISETLNFAVSKLEKLTLLSVRVCCFIGGRGLGTRLIDIMLKLEKEVRIGHGRGKRGNVSVVREHYLRDDISCKSEACVLCEGGTTPGGRG